MNIVYYLEEKSGVSPTTKYLNSLLSNINKTYNNNVALIIRAPYSSDNASVWLSKKSGIKNVVLPYTLDIAANNKLEDLYNNIIDQLLQEIK